MSFVAVVVTTFLCGGRWSFEEREDVLHYVAVFGKSWSPYVVDPWFGGIIPSKVGGIMIEEGESLKMDYIRGGEC